VFTDRKDAGIRLATKLQAYRGAADLVIGLARGGIAVAAPIAASLHIPFDALAVKKIGSPGNPELATGARVSAGQRLDIRGKTILLVDDGAATGHSMMAAVQYVRMQHPKKVIIALPVAPPDVAVKLRTLATDVVIDETPADFGAVGEFYHHFPQLTDEEVVQLLS